ncbi:MAG: double-strand break repair helicase AddA [Pseudomonadota bacterium]
MSAFQLTGDQARATRPDAHIWVDASAGTGKTHVLTARVLRLMVEGARPDSILCVTYTKAAAGEMVNRVLSRLGDWATMDAGLLKQQLGVLLGGQSRVTQAHLECARQLFLKVLDLPSGLNVQTLHAFSQSLLGRFPIEAATAPAFETIDDRTAREFAADARDSVLTAALKDDAPDIARAAETLARLLADSTFDSAIADLLAMRDALDPLPRDLANLRGIVHDVLGADVSLSKDQLLEQACEDKHFDKAGLIAVAAAIAAVGTDAEKGKKLPALDAWLSSSVDARAEGFDAYASVFLTAKSTTRSEKTLLTNKVKGACPDGLDIMVAEAHRLIHVREAIALKTLAEESSYVLAFGQQLLAQYAARKDRAGKLDYADLIARTRALLTGNIPPSWVMYRLDAQIEHVLVDEAQDNSKDQWDIIARLCEEFFAGAGQKEAPRTLFAVGDMKQSIYGFQGAQPRLFHTSRDGFKGRARGAAQVFEDVSLAKSFRSVSAVLDIVDETFKGSAGDGLDAQRVEIKHGTHRADIGGIVDLWPLSVREESEEQEYDGWRLPLQERWEKKGDRLLAERIAKDIDQRIKRGETLPGRSTPLRAGDFLILVRQRGDLMSHLARALKQRGVPIAGIDRFDLKSPLAVRDLVNLGRFASLPNDDLALACVLKSPLCNVSEDALMQLCSQRTGTVWDAAKKNDLVSHEAKELLRGVLARADYMPPFELFSWALERGARTRLLERLGNEADDAINEFLNQCLIYEQGHTPSLDGFLHWFGQSNVDVKRDPEAAGDKVRIMTIHGAKGLQAPVVYLADLSGKPRPRNQFVMLETTPEKRRVPIFRRHSGNDIGPVGAASDAKKTADYEEYKRLLYVAMTRAEDHLICAGYAAKEDDSDAQPEEPDAYQLVKAAFERLEILEDPQTRIRRYETKQKETLRPAHPIMKEQPGAPKLPAWAKAAPMEEAIPPRPLQPSDMSSAQLAPFPPEEVGSAVGALSPARRGNLIHALLQHLPQLEDGEREAAGLRYLERMLDESHAALAPDMLAQTLSTMRDPAAAPFFTTGSRAEVPIIARLGSFIVSGQVDRLALRGDTVLFADFKTTQTPPASMDDTPPGILRQMALYQASLEQVFMGKKVRAALIWTATSTLHWLERTHLLTHLPPEANTAFTPSDA